MTSLTRTLADAACQPSFARSVAMLDAGLRAPEREEWREGLATPAKNDVLTQLEELVPAPGHARARRAIEFANPHSASPGESLSRVQFRALRLPAPELQVPFRDHLGRIGEVDFYWPDLGLIGEFDGNSKYGDARRFAHHLTAEEVLIAEKTREDRLRSVSAGFVRWNWSIARDRRALSELLRARGLVSARATRQL